MIALGLLEGIAVSLVMCQLKPTADNPLVYVLVDRVEQILPGFPRFYYLDYNQVVQKYKSDASQET